MNSLKTKKLIDNELERLALNSCITSFYPTYIANKLFIPLLDVISYLDILVKDTTLLIEYDIICTNEPEVILSTKEYADVLDTYITCESCGEDIYVETSNIFPRYSLSTKFKEVCYEVVNLNKNITPRQFCTGI